MIAPILGVVAVSSVGFAAGPVLSSAPSDAGVYSAGYHHTVTTHTERIVIRGGSLVETVTVTTDYLRMKE